MKLRWMLCLALALPGAALADARLERVLGDDVVRIAFESEGDIEIVTGATPGVVVEADDEEALETVELRVAEGRLTVSREAGSYYRGLGLVTARTEVETSGMGDVEVHATEQLDAAISGMGEIVYGGSPELRERVSGRGSVERARGS
jgi:hypothetical protein